MSVLSAATHGKERYPALTGIRAFGAIAVFFDHFPVWTERHIVINVMAFFYALSGFLIVRIYYEQAQLTLTWLAKYFLNRFARIYPLYLLLLTLTLCLQHDFNPWMLLKNYTLTHALFYHTRLIIPPSWSLTVEECFYALAPLFMIAARRWGFAAAFSLGWALFAAALVVSRLDIGFLQTPTFVLTTTFFGHFVEFFAGVFLALAVSRTEAAGTLLQPGSRRTAAGLAAVSLLTIAMLVIYSRPGPLAYRPVVLINNFLIPWPIALLYWGLIRERTLLSRALSSRLAGLLGRSSYAFYLLHMPIVLYLSTPVLVHFPAYRTTVVLLTFALTWALAIGLFTFYEEPVNLALRRRFRSKDASVGIRATLFQSP